MSSSRLSRALPLSHTIRAFNRPRIRQHLLIRNYASEADKSNLRPLVLEKPDKFRPPSHPSRRPAPRRSFGPRLTTEEVEAQKTKEYPHMMPPEDSFKYKLLTSKGFHLWFSVVCTRSSLQLYSHDTDAMSRAYLSPSPSQPSTWTFTARTNIRSSCLLARSSGPIPSSTYRSMHRYTRCTNKPRLPRTS